MTWSLRAAAASLVLLALYCIASDDGSLHVLLNAVPHASSLTASALPRPTHLAAAAAAAAADSNAAVTVSSAPVHDSEIPAYLPPAFALVSSFVLGVASTGDGITFLMLWSFAGHFGLLGHNYSFAKAVFYMSFIPLFCAPPIVWAARKELVAIVGYGVLSALVACPFVLLGQFYLLQGHISVIKYTSGVMFLLFSTYHLLVSAYAFGKKRSQSCSQEPLFASTAASHAEFQLDDSQCIILNCPSRPDYPHWRWLASFYERHPALRDLMQLVFPRISESHKKCETGVVVLTVAGAASGFLQGLVGSASAPTLMAFSFMDVTKASMRGTRPRAAIRRCSACLTQSRHCRVGPRHIRPFCRLQFVFKYLVALVRCPRCLRRRPPHLTPFTMYVHDELPIYLATGLCALIGTA